MYLSDSGGSINHFFLFAILVVCQDLLVKKVIVYKHKITRMTSSTFKERSRRQKEYACGHSSLGQRKLPSDGPSPAHWSVLFSFADWEALLRIKKKLMVANL